MCSGWEYSKRMGGCGYPFDIFSTKFMRFDKKIRISRSSCWNVEVTVLFDVKLPRRKLEVNPVDRSTSNGILKKLATLFNVTFSNRWFRDLSFIFFGITSAERTPFSSFQDVPLTLRTCGNWIPIWHDLQPPIWRNPSLPRSHLYLCSPVENELLA